VSTIPLPEDADRAWLVHSSLEDPTAYSCWWLYLGRFEDDDETVSVDLAHYDLRVGNSADVNTVIGAAESMLSPKYLAMRDHHVDPDRRRAWVQWTLLPRQPSPQVD